MVSVGKGLSWFWLRCISFHSHIFKLQWPGSKGKKRSSKRCAVRHGHIKHDLEKLEYTIERGHKPPVRIRRNPVGVKLYTELS